MAFRCHLSDSENTKGFVFEDMVAKETKYEQRIREKVDFHTSFTETQDLANYLANEFNKYLQGAYQHSNAPIPQLRFLACSVLLLHDPSWPGSLRGVLVEKKLDTDRFQWTKWNDNNGGVDGKRAHKPLDVDFELKELQREKAHGLGAIEEDDEDSDDNDSLSDMESEGSDVDGSDTGLQTAGINPSDYLREYTFMMML